MIIDGGATRTLGAGEGFGEIALIRDVPRSAIVRATTALTLRGLSRATFVTAVAGYSPSAHAVDDVIDGHLARFMPTQLA